MLTKYLSSNMQLHVHVILTLLDSCWRTDNGGQCILVDNGQWWTIYSVGHWIIMKNKQYWTMDNSGQWTMVDNGQLKMVDTVQW